MVFGQAAILQHMDEHGIGSGRGREVKKTVAHCPVLFIDVVQALFEPVEALGVVEVGTVEDDSVAETFPAGLGLFPEVRRKLLQGGLYLIAIGLVGKLSAREANDLQVLRKQSLRIDGKERGHQLSMSEVSCCAEDHDAAWRQRALDQQSFISIEAWLISCHLFLTTHSLLFFPSPSLSLSHRRAREAKM